MRSTWKLDKPSSSTSLLIISILNTFSRISDTDTLLNNDICDLERAIAEEKDALEAMK